VTTSNNLLKDKLRLVGWEVGLTGVTRCGKNPKNLGVDYGFFFLFKEFGSKGSNADGKIIHVPTPHVHPPFLSHHPLFCL
jgi:hypothetical protein